MVSMVRKIFLSILCLGMAVLCSCTKNSKGSVHLSDLELDIFSGIVYMDDAEFTGTAWSDDEKSIEIIANSGELTKIVYYHENGKPAMITEPGTGVCFFNEKGQPMLDKAFFEVYGEVAQKAESIMSAIPCKE